MEHRDPSLGKYEIRPCEEGDVDIIDAKLDEAAYAIAPPVEGASDEEVVLKIEDEDGKIIAGCCLEFDSWNFVDIDILWVDEHCRGQGLGSALLREVERMARERGCYLAVLGTFSFQARGFYEKLGFTVFDAQEDYPKGCAHYCLMKRLDLPETAPRAESRFEIKRGAEEDAGVIGVGLVRYNHTRVPRLHKYISFDKKIVDESGKLVAGVAAGIDGWNVAHIDLLWADEAHPELASALLREAEREASAHGGYMALADAFDWDVEIFTRHGYEVTGRLDDIPVGHCWYRLRKML